MAVDNKISVFEYTAGIFLVSVHVVFLSVVRSGYPVDIERNCNAFFFISKHIEIGDVMLIPANKKC